MRPKLMPNRATGASNAYLPAEEIRRRRSSPASSPSSRTFTQLNCLIYFGAYRSSHRRRFFFVHIPRESAFASLFFVADVVVVCRYIYYVRFADDLILGGKYVKRCDVPRQIFVPLTNKIDENTLAICWLLARSVVYPRAKHHCRQPGFNSTVKCQQENCISIIWCARYSESFVIELGCQCFWDIVPASWARLVPSPLFAFNLIISIYYVKHTHTPLIQDSHANISLSIWECDCMCDGGWKTMEDRESVSFYV